MGRVTVIEVVIVYTVPVFVGVLGLGEPLAV